MNPINSILIANRGEIACRIIRTCRKMGIKSIAIFSEADRNSLFVEQADLAVFIGESSPAKSYLNQEKIIETAKNTGADAIHPGYGFLSENVDFVNRCEKEGFLFIGPNAKAMEAMGSKSKAKTLMKKHKVPVIPGYQGKDQSVGRLTKEAIKIGFPVLLKATAGGGGKGMRIVQEANGIEKIIEAAKRESLHAFGEDELIIEKYIASGRHIEFQIFGDKLGNIIHILERECTIQRRFQKVIEESPSPIMNDKLRTKMGEAAVSAAKALQYDNAGTVEFIYDEKTGVFYFLEVNTRLQVEHPVTEAITGLDLVQMQIESAQGLPLSIQKKDIQGKGYAMEVRLYAEDANNDFLPVTGTIHRFDCPKVEGLRVETSIKSGSEISIFYDPMIAKIIVHDATRSGAHRKMQYVLSNLICLGTITNQDFLLDLLKNEDFRAGNYDTNFIDKKINLSSISPKEVKDYAYAGIAATLHQWNQREASRTILRGVPSGWRNSFYQPQFDIYLINKKELKVNYRYFYKNNNFEFYIGDKTYIVQLINSQNKVVRVEIDGIQFRFNIAQNDSNFYVHNETIGNINLTRNERFPAKTIEKIAGGYETPMPSQIIKVLVKKGQKVKAGEGLVVLSSMKMENTIEAIENGIIEEIYAEEGKNVATGFLLLKMVTG